MDGIHDMGGMHGFGPIDTDADDRAFHGEWEGRMFAINWALMAAAGMSLDSGRASIEQLPPEEYLTLPYFGRWLNAWCQSLVDTGVFSAEEMRLLNVGKVPEIKDMPASSEHASANRLPGYQLALQGISPRRSIDTEPAFLSGQTVRGRNMHPATHTRIPHYVKGRKGVVLADRGGHVFPDTHAIGLGENPQRLYSVRFAARELWGESANANDSVTLDLWESYLEPA